METRKLNESSYVFSVAYSRRGPLHHNIVIPVIHPQSPFSGSESAYHRLITLHTLFIKYSLYSNLHLLWWQLVGQRSTIWRHNAPPDYDTPQRELREWIWSHHRSYCVNFHGCDKEAFLLRVYKECASCANYPSIPHNCFAIYRSSVMINMHINYFVVQSLYNVPMRAPCIHIAHAHTIVTNN